MTVAVDRLPGLRAAWEAAAATAWSARLACRELRYDLELPLAAIDRALADRLAALEPFGAGNPEPIFRIGPCRLAGAAETFGRGHLRFAVAGATDPAGRRGVVAWNAAERFGAGLPAELELLVNVERDRYEGVRLRLVDLRGFPSTTD
jgi:single-stranded-DNA-specific exonuclease